MSVENLLISMQLTIKKHNYRIMKLHLLASKLSKASGEARGHACYAKHDQNSQSEIF